MNNKKLTLNASDFQKFQYVASKPIHLLPDKELILCTAR